MQFPNVGADDRTFSSLSLSLFTCVLLRLLSCDQVTLASTNYYSYFLSSLLVAWGNQGGRAPEKRLARHQEQIRRLKIKWTAATQSELKAREAGNEADEWRFNCEAGNLAAKIHELENLCKQHLQLIGEKEDKVLAANKKKEELLLQQQELEAEEDIDSLRKLQFESTKKSIEKGNKDVIAAVNRLWLEWDRSWADIGPNLPPPPVPRPKNLHVVGNQICTDTYYEAQQTTRQSLRARLGTYPLLYVQKQGKTWARAAERSAAQAASDQPSTSQEEDLQDPEDSFIHFDE